MPSGMRYFGGEENMLPRDSIFAGVRGSLLCIPLHPHPASSASSSGPLEALHLKAFYLGLDPGVRWMHIQVPPISSILKALPFSPP